MRDNFPTVLGLVLKHEGGFVDHPEDPGGMTNLGVTKAVWESWVGHPVSEREMRALTPEKVAPMYKRRYWDRVRGDELPSGVDLAVFDAAVNSGVGRGIKWLQEAMDFTPDGNLTPEVLAAAEMRDHAQLVTLICTYRLAFLMQLPTWRTFGKGWARRVSNVVAEAADLME